MSDPIFLFSSTAQQFVRELEPQEKSVLLDSIASELGVLDAQTVPRGASDVFQRMTSTGYIVTFRPLGLRELRENHASKGYLIADIRGRWVDEVAKSTGL